MTRLFLKGLAVVLPIGVTIYLLLAIGTIAEDLVGDGLLRRVLPESAYVPGMGVIAGFALILATGLAMKSYVARRIVERGERLVNRIPGVKTLYGALKDAMGLLGGDEKKNQLGKVVFVRYGETRLLGFLTREGVGDFGLDDHVAVYLPMSYQLGGYTVIIPRESIEHVDMSVEDALRFSVTAGMSKRTTPPATSADAALPPGALPGVVVPPAGVDPRVPRA